MSGEVLRVTPRSRSFLESLRDNLVDGVADLEDDLGQLDALPLDAGVVGVLGDVGVVLGHHGHLREPEVLTHLQDRFLVVAGRGAHPGHQRVLGVGVVALGDVVVGVVAGRAVALVEGAVRDRGEGDPVAHQVVLDDLRGRDNDAGVRPQCRAVVGTDLAGEDDDVVVLEFEGLAVELGVLLDQRLRRGQQERLPADGRQSLGGDQQRDGGLAESGRETDERVVPARRLGQIDLVPAVLEELRRHQRAIDVLATGLGVGGRHCPGVGPGGG